MSLSEFFTQLSHTPALWVTSVLTLGVIFVNGWTDAPNAIATCVVTRAMRPRSAILMAALCNFAGVLFMTMISPRVAETIFHMVDFGSDARAAQIALSAAMLSIVAWAVFAWAFGIPTSESHALAAGLTGAAVAQAGDLSCIRWWAWGRVLGGLILSVLLAFWAGRAVQRRLARLRADPRALRLAQLPGAAAAAFLHGAQDGQKLLGVFLLGLALAQGQGDAPPGPVPLWLSLLCAAAMSGGTALGGRRIIDRMGRDMVALDPCRALSTDLAGALSLWAATLLGLPVSTTHTRTAALLGVGSAGGTSPDWSVARQVALAWLLTFPCCALLGWAAGRVFLGWL